MLNQPATQSRGFTIIETLIALGAGSLILVLAFMAIPGLQRSSRNDMRKQDVATILERVSRYQLNNTGNFPTNTDILATADLKVYVGNPAEIAAYPDIKQPDEGVAFNYSANPSASPLPAERNTSTESVWVYNRRKCDAYNSGQSTSAGAGFRDVVALFAVEGANNSVSQCRQL